MKEVSIYPSILSTNVRDYRYKIKTASKYFKGVQIDVMDGKFVKNRTFKDLSVINRLKPKKLYCEVQLMVKDSLKSILEWARVADRYILHIESTSAIKPLIQLSRALNKSVGLALNPATPLSVLRPYLGTIDMALVMTVKPGKSGQQFIPEMLAKIKRLRKIAPKLPIEVDGGINENNAKKVVDAGATILVMGSYLWKNKDLKNTLSDLRTSLYAK